MSKAADCCESQWSLLPKSGSAGRESPVPAGAAQELSRAVAEGAATPAGKSPVH